MHSVVGFGIGKVLRLPSRTLRTRSTKKTTKRRASLGESCALPSV